jgi:TPR repeat protein
MKKMVLGVFLVGIILTTGGGALAAGTISSDLKQGAEAYGRKDYTQAYERFLKAAETGDPTAQTFVGYLYTQGLGVRKDFKEAFKWFEKAALAGNAIAQYNLGRLYSEGAGVTKDETLAAKWYLKAAEQDQVDAEVALGFAYKKGAGVELSMSDASKWFKKAADAGNTVAKNQLGYSVGEENSPGTSRHNGPSDDDESRLKQETGYKAPGYPGPDINPAPRPGPSHRTR